jgi:hypothetical protein
MTSRGARNAREIAQFRLLPLFLALLAAGAECAAGQATEPVVEQPRFTMKISVTGGNTIESGFEVLVAVDLTNTSAELIGPERVYPFLPSYRMRVSDRSGEPAPLTCLGKLLGKVRKREPFAKGDPCLSDAQASQFFGTHLIGNSRFFSIQPGKTVRDWVSISDEFDLSQPGTYTIQLERFDPGTKLAVKSNTIALTVTN